MRIQLVYATTCVFQILVEIDLRNVIVVSSVIAILHEIISEVL